MAQGRPHLRIAGVPVRFDLSFFVIVGLLGLSGGQDLRFAGSFVAIATVSILVHELGHAAAFRRFGGQPSVLLYGFGGVTTGPGDLGPRRDIVVSLAGPLTQLVALGLPALWLTADATGLSLDARTVLDQVVWINIAWPLLNLAPILPLDGGNVVASGIDLARPGQGRRIAHYVSIATALAVLVWAGRTGWLFLALLAGFFLVQNIGALTRARDEQADESLRGAWGALVAHDGPRAEAAARAGLAARPKGEQLRWAQELVAWSRLAQGDVPGAWAAAGATTPTSALQGALALAGGRVDQGVALLAWAIAHEPEQRARILAAIAAAQTGQVPAVAHELRLLGSQAPGALALFAQLLAHAGYRAEAGWVTAP